MDDIRLGRPRLVDFGELMEAIFYPVQRPRTMWELAEVLEVSVSTARRAWRDFQFFLRWSNGHTEFNFDAMLDPTRRGS
jgi:hypothetical protein